MARWMLIVLSAGLALAGGAAFADSVEAIQVGMARIDITPPIDMKATLGGYGERMSRPASGVHDRLFAKALVVNSADKKFALVTLDALGLPPAVKPAVLEKLAGDGWKEEEILLLPSHSHTSIEMNAINPKNVFPIPNLGIYQPALFDLVVGKLVEVIRAAGSQRVDAR
ncbi:MAG: neutral/alkaline non-lysosomal ceramidase N-terminal domain-containing protein, partial [Candidatus Omnitrophica bacterium]|nr:neutral/alkaline non-lysosomal ceramidase N-terminal domain-containing protein [Candidatus Omnitrophota bacterium]